MIPLPPLPTPTTPPIHYLARRHFYTCDTTTLAWQPEWYTAPFYTASSSSYDDAASLGPVNPPNSVLTGNAACAALTASASASGPGASSGSRGASGSGTIVTVTSFSGSSTFEQVMTTVLGGLSTVSSSGSRSLSTTSVGSSSTASLTATVTTNPSTITFSPSGISSSSTTPFTPLAQITDSSAINTCAGEMDFQAWGAIAGAGFSVLIGGLLWLLWAVLRGRIPSLYSPRTYFVPSDSRPSGPFSIVAFLFPFLPSTKSSPGSSPSFALPVVLASLKLLVMSAVVALAAALPLFLVNTPCLSQTSPANYLGGRLGTLTDLSLLRLLNALDPSPESSSRDTSIQLLLQTNLRRALPQTIGPALSSARVRLIVILVLVGLLSLVGGLYVVTRTYAQLSARKRKFEQETCGGIEMVVVAVKDAPGWKGMSEDDLRKTLAESAAGRGDEGDNEELSVIGVFAEPDTTDLKRKVVEREAALLNLELEEAEYLRNSVRRPLMSPRIPTSDLPHSTPSQILSATQSQQLLPPSSPQAFRFSEESTASSLSQTPHRRRLASRPDQSRFREINRNSLQASFVQFEIGQRIKVDENGKFIPDTSPDSGSDDDGRHQLGNVPESSGSLHSQDRPSTSTEGARLVPGPARQPDLQPSPPYQSLQPSAVPSPSIHPSGSVERARMKLKEMNEEVERLQSSAMRAAATGRDTVGWVVVGRGVRHIPKATRIDGWTLEDIDWQNIGIDGNGKRFWAKVLAMGIVLGLILIPFIGLTNTSAPGFAYYLPFLRSLADGDGFGSGVVQAFVPGVVMAMVVIIAVQGSIFFAHQIPTISKSRRDLLATQATFWLLLGLCVVWAILVSCLEFAIQALNGETQKTRAVSDGSIYSTWWLSVFMLNLAIILPVVILLQPGRLITYIRRHRAAKTPRMLFRATKPAPLTPALLLAGPILAVLYTLSLSLIFPLLCIPLLILLYLSFIVLRYMTDRVFVDQSFIDGHLALWLIRRLGWCLCIQPILYGLILLSRREWAIGGISCGIALLSIILAEILTARRLPERRRNNLTSSTRANLDVISAGMRNSPTPSHSHSRSPSDSSMLQRLTALLPGYSRLPPTCPLPLRPQTIDDMTHTELASVTRRDLVSGRDIDGDRFFHDPTETNKGMIYPPEMLQPAVIVWLPYTRGSEAEDEAAELEGVRGLVAIVDPAPKDPRGENMKEADKGKGS